MLKFTEDETLQLVTLYSENECLWNLSSNSYRNKNMKLAAESDIVEKLGKNGFGVTEFRQKIKNLRCTYNQECLKIKKSMRSGAGTDDRYVPSVKWFDAMDSILKNAKGNKKTEDSVETNISHNSDKEGEEEDGTVVEDTLSTARPSDQDTPVSRKSASHTPSRERPPSAKRNRLDNLTHAVQQLKEVSESFNNNENSIDEHDAFATFVGATLKQLGRRDALLAQNEIQGILLKYRLGVEFADNNNDNEAHSSHKPIMSQNRNNYDYQRDLSTASPSHNSAYSNYSSSSYYVENNDDNNSYNENTHLQGPGESQENSDIIERAFTDVLLNIN